MQHLQQLRPPLPSLSPATHQLGPLVCYPLPSHIVTPIRISVLAHYLSSHPDNGLVTYLTHGFQHGFDLMFVGPITSTSSRNLRYTDEFHEVVTHALHSELLLGHISGPFSSPPFSMCHCSPLGAVLKPFGKISLILDLSQPRGTSVNEGILEEFCSVRYSVFDDAAKLARLAGESAMMAKIDRKHAFWLCPVRMVDRPLFCFQWEKCILWAHVYLLGVEHFQQYSIHFLMPWLGSIILCIIWMIFACVQLML